jgi:hypothetical protein
MRSQDGESGTDRGALDCLFRSGFALSPGRARPTEEVGYLGGRRLPLPVPRAPCLGRGPEPGSGPVVPGLIAKQYCGVQVVSPFLDGGRGVDVEVLCGRQLDALVASACLLRVQRQTDHSTGDHDAFYHATPRARSPSWVPETAGAVASWTSSCSGLAPTNAAQTGVGPRHPMLEHRAAGGGCGPVRDGAAGRSGDRFL